MGEGPCGGGPAPCVPPQGGGDRDPPGGGHMGAGDVQMTSTNQFGRAQTEMGSGGNSPSSPFAVGGGHPMILGGCVRVPSASCGCRGQLVSTWGVLDPPPRL